MRLDKNDSQRDDRTIFVIKEVNNRWLKVQRNELVSDGGDYFIDIGLNGLRAYITLNDEEMLDLFRAYLIMKAEYDAGS